MPYIDGQKANHDPNDDSESERYPVRVSDLALYVSKFLVDNEQRAVDRVRREFALVDAQLERLEQELQNEHRIRMREQVVDALADYKQTFARVVENRADKRGGYDGYSETRLLLIDAMMDKMDASPGSTAVEAHV